MKGKIITAFTAVLFGACMALGLTACGGNSGGGEANAHVHTYNENNVCTSCGYELEYTEGLLYINQALEHNGEWIEGYVCFSLGTAETTDITVPAYYNGKPVHSVVLSETYFAALMAAGDITEADCVLNETSITVPDGVLYVRINSPTLTSLELSETVVYLYLENCDNLATETVSGLTYCNNWVIDCDESLTSAQVRDGTLGIGFWAFYGCSDLTQVTLPDSLISICDSAFYACSALTGITIPDNVVNIGAAAFKDCTSLKSANIPDGVTYINDGVFNGCSSLESINIPEGVTGIYVYAFNGCASLKSITIPSTVKKIHYFAFNGCTSLESITFIDASGWTNGSESVDLSDAALNADYFANTYSYAIWSKE